MSLLVAKIEADMQKNVGEFLAQKSYLVSMKASANPTIATKASELYDRQVVLEKELNVALAEIEVIKQGAYSFSGIRKISSFIIDLRQHTQRTKAFLSGKKMPSIELIPNKGAITAGVGVLGLLWWTRR